MRKIKYNTNQNDPQIKAYKEALEKGKKNHHVLFRDNAWVVVHAGTQKAIDEFKTQSEAISKATLIASSQGTAVFIHGLDGRIQDRRDYK